ncbi:hypothetical protein DY000_02054445 [Brassica cretica]|uniref:MSP domain-containing protein n=1 Tax=Brassica cretica TaxID=69181 RepID=A0ABQ7AGQ9_BRACR|nr:hypothetical protein DY000_02054445 [Brassica cretica]
MNNPRSVNSSASPANLDLVENQRQSSSGEFSRIEKRNGATKMSLCPEVAMTRSMTYSGPCQGSSNVKYQISVENPLTLRCRIKRSLNL